MPANRIHLVRHGEVDNPNKVLYGRLPNFALTALGRQMAEATAQELASTGANYTKLISSPLIRTLQSARPISGALKLSVATESLSASEMGRADCRVRIRGDEISFV